MSELNRHSAGASIPMMLNCPRCEWPHVDCGEFSLSVPHAVHLCDRCKHEWQPKNMPTRGAKSKAEILKLAPALCRSLRAEINQRARWLHKADFSLAAKRNRLRNLQIDLWRMEHILHVLIVVIVAMFLLVLWTGCGEPVDLHRVDVDAGVEHECRCEDCTDPRRNLSCVACWGIDCELECVACFEAFHTHKGPMTGR